MSKQMKVVQHLSRRLFCGAVAAGVLAPTVARAQGEAARRAHGRMKPPVAVPELKLLRHDGFATTFFDLLNHHITAVQLMFAQCTTTCPIQGAIFARVQKLLPDQRKRGIQLVSITINPEHDRPAVMKDWLQRFKARPGWIGAVPEVADVDRLREFSGGGRTPSDNHSLQVQMFNREAKLIWRTDDMPDAEEIATILRKL